jgi:hypothetical protein
MEPYFRASFAVQHGAWSMANTREPILKPIPILALRPTQMTVGMREVKEKRKRWREHKSEKKRAEPAGAARFSCVRSTIRRNPPIDDAALASR